MLALADFFDSVDRTAALVERAATRLPALAAVARRTSRFVDENARVRKAISQHGDVQDDASPALASVRDKLRRQRQRLRGTLESYLRGRDTAKYLQEKLVTSATAATSSWSGANTAAPSRASSTGFGQRRQPLSRAASTVEVNNDIVALEDQEAEEVRRILLALTDATAAARHELAGALTAATELDASGRPGARCRSTASARHSRTTAGSNCGMPAIRC